MGGIERSDKEVDTGPRVAVVLGGGWTLGASYHAGVLLALRDAWGVDARQVDSLTGTSAGAITAGFVGAGMSVDDLFKRETGEDLSQHGRSIVDRVGDKRRLRNFDWFGGPPASLRLAVRGAADRRIAVGTAAAGLAPRGHRPVRALQSYFDQLMDGMWPAGTNLRFCAVDLGSGRLAALDRSCGTSPGRALAASCSVPGVSRPVKIGEGEYIDGAVHSVNNAQTVRSTEPDIVIISAPLSIDHGGFGRTPMGMLRNRMRSQTAHEQRNLGDQARIVVVEPTAADSKAMGMNLTANSRRERVARQAYASAIDVFERSAPVA